MESLEFIDNYIKGELSGDELARFEKRILEDPAFAEELAFYISAMQSAKELSSEDSKKRFLEIYRQESAVTHTPKIRRLWPYLAAAVIVGVVAGLFIFIKPSSNPQKLADAYIQKNFQPLPVTMSSRADSIQTGLRLYNEGRFSESLKQFENIIQSDTGRYDAETYAGIVCLRMGKYDQAIDWFDKLENNTHLYINYGKFYHALTLLKRGQKNDNVLAKQLLQQVVDQGLEGKEEAAKWLEKWQP